MIQVLPIPNFPNYKVSNDGSVFTVRRKGSAGGKLRPANDRYGYPYVVLYQNGARKTRRICRLVLETFVGLRPKNMECRHLDGVRTNSHLENLIWGTPKENQADRNMHGTANIGERNGQAKLTTTKVQTIRQMYKLKQWRQWELAKMFNVGQDTISLIVNYKLWKHLKVQKCTAANT